MTRWNWTWEEPPSIEDNNATDAQPVQHTRPVPQSPFRRRRVGAALALLAILALALVVISFHAGAGHPQAPAASTHAYNNDAPATRLTPADQSVIAQHALARHAENKAINSVLTYTPAVVQGGTKGNEVALTFDDGPGPYTQRLVDVLNALRVHATFFAIGEEEQYFSAGTLAELRSGDVVGDHTETHPMMASLSRHDQHQQLLEQIYRIQLLGGPTPRLFRPPYGSFNPTTFRELHALHLLMILWSTDTADYTRPGAPAIVQSALAGAHPGAIILMHDAGGDRSETIAALPAIVRGLRERGLRPVTVPRLLLDDPPPPHQHIPTSLEGG
jgi:peptidoglycan-N-acetylglucosamine deacetylase